MERPIIRVHKSYLVYINKSKNSIELECLHFCRSDKSIGFSDDFVSKSTLTSRLEWDIKDVKQCTDDRTGIDTLYMLGFHNSESATKKRFCIIQAKWRTNTSIFKHSAKSARELPSLELIPAFEFTCNAGALALCALTYGPRVVVAAQNKILLFSGKPNERHIRQTCEYPIVDISPGETSCTAATSASFVSDRHNSTQIDIAQILSIFSEQNWTLAVLLISLNRCLSVVAVALEKSMTSGEFEGKKLKTAGFLPQEYASKVSTFNFQVCRKRTVEDGPCSYENHCVMGLNDGYVITLTNGRMHSCIAPWKYVDAAYPAFAVKEVLLFNDVLICHTDTKDCFVVHEVSNKVMHHWDNVRKPLVGDFLQCGGNQLLLLFGSGLLQQPDAEYLLTDLLGFVVDKRKKTMRALSQEIPGEGDVLESIERVITALQEQNQALVRTVREEEQKLESKQLFVAETWRRLQMLSLSGLEAVPDLAVPEVPLVPLVGGGARPEGFHQTKTPVCDHCEVIKVQLMWHHVVDSRCVLGIKLINMSDRDLTNCIVTLTTPTESLTTSIQQQLSSCTKVWQSFRADAASSTNMKLPQSDTSLQKRQKVEPQLHVRQTEIIQPSESVTVTCVFELPDLGACREVELCVHLQIFYAGGKDLYTCSRPSSSTLLSKDLVKINEKTGDVTPSVGKGSAQPCKAILGGQRTKCISCGFVVIKASELLQQSEQLSTLMEKIRGLENSSGVHIDSRLEEELLALSTIQDSWSCNVSFILHEVTVLARCLLAAGFVFHESLGQYIISPASPACLRFVRVQLLGFRPLPERAALILVFVRDSSQFLLLLQHLYSHLPEDASITLDTEQHDLNLSQLTKVMSAELDERKREARAVIEAQKTRVERSAAEQHQKTPLGTGETRGTDIQGSNSGSLMSESDAFVEQQRLYRLSRRSCVHGEDVAEFVSAVQECETETDIAVAELKL